MRCGLIVFIVAKLPGALEMRTWRLWRLVPRRPHEFEPHDVLTARIAAVNRRPIDAYTEYNEEASEGREHLGKLLKPGDNWLPIRVSK